MPDDVFWEATPRETLMVMRSLSDREYERRRHEALCAGGIRATLVNIYKKKGARLAKATDFVARKPIEDATEKWQRLKDHLQRAGQLAERNRVTRRRM